MATPAILAIDQGTTNTKALLFDPAGRVVARASRPMTVTHPQPGWAEQSGQAIWRSVADAIDAVLASAGDHAVAGVAISNQRETVLLWNAETGEPVGPCVIWQCRRSAERCAALSRRGLAGLVRSRTGLGLDPLFPAAKLGWLLDAIPEARLLAERGTLRAGTVDSWLLWNLTAGAVHATDFGNASRTQLFAIEAGAWDADLSGLFEVPLSILPAVRPSDSLFGMTAAGATRLPPGLPIHAMMGDSHAALFGHGIEAPGQIKATCGTGSSLMMLTGDRVSSSNGLSGTIAWNRGGTTVHALEGNITVSGHAAAFMARLLHLPDERALAALAASVPDSGGVMFVPALAGLGAPHWDTDARGLISGMSLGTRPAHLARAAIEAIALQIHDVFRAMEADLGRPLPALWVDGGATRNDLLMTLLAGLIERPVLRRDLAELSAFGAARMAAASLGIPLGDEGLIETRFEPALPAAARDRIIGDWRAAIARARSDLPEATA